MSADAESSPDALLDAGANGLRLVGRRCGSCDAIQFPPRDRCVDCGGDGLKPLRFDLVATLETYSVVHVPQAGFEPPYPVGFARLSPGDVRAFGPLDADPAALSVGRGMVPTVLDPEETFVPERTWGFTIENGGDSR